MAAGSWLAFDAGALALEDDTITKTTDTFQLVLVTDLWTPDAAANTTWADISANEVAAGGGYTANGKAVSGITVSLDSGVVKFDVPDQTWTSSTITAKYAVLVHDANADNALAGTDIPVFYVDLDTGGGSVSSTNADFTVSIDATGAYRLTYA